MTQTRYVWLRAGALTHSLKTPPLAKVCAGLKHRCEGAEEWHTGGLSGTYRPMSWVRQDLSAWAITRNPPSGPLQPTATKEPRWALACTRG